MPNTIEPVNRNYKLTIQYDGTHYFGWQTQAKGRTVQGEIERALSEIFPNQKITLYGSGRTDSGVHALDQVANVHLQSVMAPSVLQKALNSKLGNDVLISKCSLTADNFNARHSAVARTYIYNISQQYSPFNRNTNWIINYKVDPSILSDCASKVIGNRDFTAFCKAKAEVNHKWCVVSESRWDFQSDQLTYTITANRFLQHMVRFLVGTMIEVARGRMTMNDFILLLDDDHPTLSVYRAPAKGLFLLKVQYQD